MTIIQPAYEVRGPEGLCAESAWAVTCRQRPHSGVGEDFLARRPGYPHENGRNSETKSRKIDQKVPKRNHRQGLPTPLRQKTGSQIKPTISISYEQPLTSMVMLVWCV